MHTYGVGFIEGVDAPKEKTIYQETLQKQMEKYFKGMNVDTSKTYEYNLLSEKASYFENTLMWKEVGQLYLEGKDNYSDTSIYHSMHEIIK
jgi:hypothetical protein